MTIRPLRYLGDPVLRTPCDRVVRFDAALARLVADLLDTVSEPGRAGLAANQIGSGLAVFSYNVDGELGYLINPQVAELSGGQDGPEASPARSAGESCGTSPPRRRRNAPAARSLLPHRAGTGPSPGVYPRRLPSKTCLICLACGTTPEFA